MQNKTLTGTKVQSYSETLNGQIGSSTEHCKKKLSICKKEYQLRLDKEQHTKVNKKLGTQ